MNWKQGATFAVAGALILILVILALRVKEKDDDRWINLAVIVLGLSVGWLLGVYIAPYGSDEATQFRELATAVSVFLSGYLVAKVDGLITKLLSPEQVMHPVSGFRLIAAFSSFVLSLIVTYVGRAYM